jgi:hypothetical protein
MANYFDYIPDESSNYSDDVYDESYLDDTYDIDDVITEADLALMEFDSYVQEGVGLNVAIGIGIGVALAGLVALIIKLFKKNSDKGAKKKTEDAKKEATKAAKIHGGDTPVKKRKKFSFFKRNKNFEESYEYTSYEDFYQEAASKESLDLVRALGEETEFVCKLIDIYVSAFKGMKSPVACLQATQDLSRSKSANTMKSIKMSDLISKVSTPCTINTIIAECNACIGLNRDIANLSNKLNKSAKSLELAEKNSISNDQAIKTMREKIISPAIAKLQNKIITTNQAIVSVMDENISALKNIGESSDDIGESVRANTSAYDYESRIRR